MRAPPRRIHSPISAVSTTPGTSATSRAPPPCCPRRSSGSPSARPRTGSTRCSDARRRLGRHLAALSRSRSTCSSASADHVIAFSRRRGGRARAARDLDPPRRQGRALPRLPARRRSRRPERDDAQPQARGRLPRRCSPSTAAIAPGWVDFFEAEGARVRRAARRPAARRRPGARRDLRGAGDLGDLSPRRGGEGRRSTSSSPSAASGRAASSSGPRPRRRWRRWCTRLG